MYEIFDHTADLGLRVRAASLPVLLEDAARGLTEIIAGASTQIGPLQTETFTVQGADPALLLFDWLNELLYTFESRRMLFSKFEVVVNGDAGGLRAVAHGERYDPGRHFLAHEVKAITYHGLEAKRVGDRSCDGWEATVIVDI